MIVIFLDPNTFLPVLAVMQFFDCWNNIAQWGENAVESCGQRLKRVILACNAQNPIGLSQKNGLNGHSVLKNNNYIAVLRLQREAGSKNVRWPVQWMC